MPIIKMNSFNNQKTLNVKAQWLTQNLTTSAQTLPSSAPACQKTSPVNLASSIAVV